MKKLLLFCIFLICSLPLWTEEEKLPPVTEKKTNVDTLQSEKKYQDLYRDLFKEEDLPIRLKNRGFEIALLNLSAGFGNSFIAAKDILQETAIINLDDFFGGFKASFGVDLAPMSININRKNKWGLGFELSNVSAFGNIEIFENLLRLRKTESERFGVGGAAFVDFGISTFFHIKKLKVKLRPAVYLPIIYAEPGATYRLTENENGFYAAVNYDMYIYAPISLSFIETQSFDYNELGGAVNGSTLGFDFNTAFEFPVFSWLDVGVNILSTPIKPSVLNHYLQIAGEVFFDTSEINFVDLLINGGEFPKDAYGYPAKFEPKYGIGEKKILRPFKFITYAVFQRFKFKTLMLAFIPCLGFAINPVYTHPDSIEAGLKIRLDLANMFITTMGVNYEDRLWRNSINFEINLKLVELDIGLSFESQKFVKSWQGAGARGNFALKLGW